MVFMPNSEPAVAACKALVDGVLRKEGLKLLGWRKVPVHSSVVGRFAKVTEPSIWQLFVEGKAGQAGEELEREMFITRKLVEAAKVEQLAADVAPDFYFCTLSNQTIVYKVRGGPGEGGGGGAHGEGRAR